MPKGRQETRFRSLTRHISTEENGTILDFGCGLAHLKDYLDEHKFGAGYHGVDVVPEFIERCRTKFPLATFELLNEDGYSGPIVDHAVVSGTFNLIEGNRRSHWNSVKNAILQLSSKATKSIALNFMSDQVDFVQSNAFHVSPMVITDFVRSSISRRFVLDQSYMPYEFTIIAIKDQAILRPINIFENVLR